MSPSSRSGEWIARALYGLCALISLTWGLFAVLLAGVDFHVGAWIQGCGAVVSSSLLGSVFVSSSIRLFRPRRSERPTYRRPAVLRGCDVKRPHPPPRR